MSDTLNTPVLSALLDTETPAPMPLNRPDRQTGYEDADLTVQEYDRLMRRLGRAEYAATTCKLLIFVLVALLFITMAWAGFEIGDLNRQADAVRAEVCP